MSQTKKNTRQRLLDAAEELFARNGFAGTSLRSLTQAAGANLAAVNYHFGSKEGLIEEVIKRRLLPLNEQRMIKLTAECDAAHRENRPPEPAAILKAFLEPTLSFSRSGPGPHFTTLISRALNDSDDTARKIFLKNIQPVFRLMLSSLCEASPDISAPVLFWRLHFFIGSIIHTVNMHNRGLIPPDLLQTDSKTADIFDMILSYSHAGMLASP